MLTFILLILAILFIEKSYPFSKDEPEITQEEFYRSSANYDFDEE